MPLAADQLALYNDNKDNSQLFKKELLLLLKEAKCPE
jgi:hypothetical protein